MTPLVDDRINRTLHVQVLKPQTLRNLLASGSDACKYENEEPLVVILTLTANDEEAKKGSFKVASKGSCSPPIFDSNSTVCAKQAYKPIGMPGKGWTLKVPGFPKLHPFEDQKIKLKTELRALAWGSALLNYVYEFIKAKNPDNDIDIPKFRFVNAALATEGQEVPQAQRQVYLLEEFIDNASHIQGNFRKYINNGLARPLDGLDAIDRLRARFLCFTQHVQYMMTGKLAFISDYQGKLLVYNAEIY